MKTLLQINTSIFAGDGQSTRLANEFSAHWLANTPNGRVVVRDLAAEPVPHLSAERFTAFALSAHERSPAQNRAVDESNALINELRNADEVVLGLPLYNFGVPSTLKAWIDHIARAGITFRYSDNGPVGLLADRPVHIIATRGGLFRGTPWDTQSDYIRNVMRFIGITDIHFIYAEGLSSGGQREQALANASNAIRQLRTTHNETTTIELETA